VLRIENLTKVYTMGGGISRSRLVAVNGASLTVGDSGPEIFTLAGESGSGKTTIARIALGLVEPTSGTLEYQGKSLVGARRRQARLEFMKQVQPIFQNPFETFNPLKKVLTYLRETVINFALARDDGDIEGLVRRALESVGLSLEDVGDKYPNEFSGGQLQRASIARALITDPSLLIADEPVSMVDASMRMSIVNLFKQLKEQRGVSVLYITHDLATAYYAADRIAVMLRGNIVEIGPVESVLGQPLHPYTRLLIESIPEPDTDQAWKGEIALSTFEDLEYAQQGCKFAGRCPHVMDVCRRTDPQLQPVDGRTVRCWLYGEKR
jgi:peptide/nickel transport system ATP-binding protein